jgi:hypothetical protein
MLKILIAIFLFVVLGSIRCVSKDSSQRQVKLNVIDSNTHKVDDTLIYTTIVPGNKQYSLQIRTTYLNDIDYVNNGWPTEQNQVVLGQELIFEYMDSILCAIPFHVQKRTSIKLNKKISLLDAVVFEAAIINGTKGSIYKIRGSGGCTDCSNYTGYYSLKGTLLFENYFSHKDKFVKNFGDYKKVLRRYGVEEKVHNIKNITVFPPAHAGETSDGYVL